MAYGKLNSDQTEVIQHPVSRGEIEELEPEYIFSRTKDLPQWILDKYNYVKVHQGPRPRTGPDQKAEKGPIVFDNGKWKTSWTTRDLSGDEIEARQSGILSKVKELRYDNEVGGFDYQGYRIPTDRASQAKFTGAYVDALAAIINNTPEAFEGITWEIQDVDGNDSALTISTTTEMLDFGQVVKTFVGICFYAQTLTRVKIQNVELNKFEGAGGAEEFYLNSLHSLKVAKGFIEE